MLTEMLDILRMGQILKLRIGTMEFLEVVDLIFVLVIAVVTWAIALPKLVYDQVAH